MMKRFLFLALAAIAGWLANSSPATAGEIGPGLTTTSVANNDNPLTLTTGALANYGGTVVADTGSLNYTFGGIIKPNTGTVREIVVQDTLNPYGNGKLSFIFQVHVTAGDITRLTNSIYDGPTTKTDVGQVTANGGALILPGTLDTTGTRQAQSADRLGSAVGFNFSPAIFSTDAAPANTTLALIIRTNADLWGSGFIGLIDGGADQEVGFAPLQTLPTPEPASIVLLGFGAGGMLAYRWKRRQA